VLLDGLEDPAAADMMVSRLGAELDRPLSWQGCTLPLTASVGLAVSGPEVGSLEVLTSRADRDMYRAKLLRSAR
jgi:GGDEF domain-containing protein